MPPLLPDRKTPMSKPRCESTSNESIAVRSLTAKRSFQSTPRLPKSSDRSLPRRSSSDGWPEQTASTGPRNRLLSTVKRRWPREPGPADPARAAQAVSNKNLAATGSSRPLGKGAMGMVYLAEDTQLQRHVALKTPHFEQEPTAELLERFYREARSAATLRHPKFVRCTTWARSRGRTISRWPTSTVIRSRPSFGPTSRSPSGKS